MYGKKSKLVSASFGFMEYVPKQGWRESTHRQRGPRICVVAVPGTTGVYRAVSSAEKVALLEGGGNSALPKSLPADDREKRQQGLRMLMGLNSRREGGPVDGLQFQEEQRAEW